MKLKQVSVFLENKPGALNEPCRVLADAGINISNLTLADTEHYGILRLLLKDWAKAKEVLESKGFAVKLVDVIAVLVDHKTGSLSEVLELFARNNANVEYLYAFPGGMDGKAVIIFCFDDPDSALEKLRGQAGITIVDPAALFAE